MFTNTCFQFSFKNHLCHEKTCFTFPFSSKRSQEHFKESRRRIRLDTVLQAFCEESSPNSWTYFSFATSLSMLSLEESCSSTQEIMTWNLSFFRCPLPLDGRDHISSRMLFAQEVLQLHRQPARDPVRRIFSGDLSSGVWNVFQAWP